MRQLLLNIPTLSTPQKPLEGGRWRRGEGEGEGGEEGGGGGSALIERRVWSGVPHAVHGKHSGPIVDPEQVLYEAAKVVEHNGED